MTGSKKDQLRKLGVISPMDELRETLAATSDPGGLKQMRELVLGTVGSSFAQQMRESAIGSIGSSFFQQLRESQLGHPGGLIQMRELTLGSVSSSFLQQTREQVAALTQQSYLSQMREQMAALTNPTNLFQMREAAVSVRIQEEFSAALASYRELVAGSALANFLVSADEDESPPPQRVEVEGFDSLEIGDFAELETGPLNDVDREIVKAISEGSVETLSPTAMQRLQSITLLIVAYWDMLLRIFNTCMAVVYLTALMSGSTVPADIPKQAEQLSNHERELLADYRIVNREGANLRAEPSKKAEVIVQLSLGLPVEVLENNGKGWFHVVADYKGESVEGWIHLTVTTPVPPPKKSLELGQNKSGS
ncbi:SH3 domain-containing protein [uncultured Pseudomonas sp.]|uniref:SH3 domain-containing protein n=1 Tax=uncultured Pseudomonas sp. TaxID=114707 RepID=UPI0025D37959|nr:SH3 domain-containing protein [uncultured Pseudomonas sp.]